MANLIGTAPNQVPTNGDLGTMAFQDSDNAKMSDSVITNPRILTSSEFYHANGLNVTNSKEFAVEFSSLNNGDSIDIVSNLFGNYVTMVVEITLVGRVNGLASPHYFRRVYSACTDTANVVNIGERETAGTTGWITFATSGAGKSFKITIANSSGNNLVGVGGTIKVTTPSTVDLTLAYS